MTLAQPLRILLATARYFPYMGGIETHVYEVSRRLARLGCDVTVLTTDPSGRLPEREVKDNVEIRRVRAYPAQRDYYFAPGVARVVAEKRWDVVHSQGSHTLVPPLVMGAALRTGTPYVVTFHTGGHSARWRNAIRPLQWTILRPLLRRAERFVAVSRYEASFFQPRLGVSADRFAFIPNGSDLPDVSTLPTINDNGTWITSVGRLERFKGHHRVLAALPRVLQERGDVRLRILGTGPYESALRQQAVELGVADRVQIGAIPATDRQRMAAVLSEAKLVTLFSEAESNPVAVMEAVALGRSVLVANTSGLRELADRGYVRAIPLESSDEEVAAAILRQLREPLTPPKLNLPTWDGCAEQLLAVYQSVVGRTACAS